MNLFLTFSMYGLLALAALPAVMFLWNLFIYRPPRGISSGEPVSVLIPARNEEHNIRAALESVLQDHDIELEVIVLDDHSTDRTAGIVREMAEADPRVRLASAPSLPEGWCGKQHACQKLAEQAGHSLLLFMDADVRLEPGAVGRMAGFLSRSGADLISGIPRQITGTFSEKLLIPLIPYVLLGFLPMFWMRKSKKPGFAAGCGQLFMARREAYFASGGHESIKESLHDGLTLPRSFRLAGKRTDLFDATSVARCRMFQCNKDVWAGLGRNANEGMAAPSRIGLFTVLLFGGQVLPFLWLLIYPGWLAALAVALAWLPRFLGVWRFKQSVLSAVLHPLGIVGLLVIQWAAFFRGKPSHWKGRDYAALPTACGLILFFCMNAAVWAEPEAIPDFELEDQYGEAHSYQFPKARISVILVADHPGSDQLEAWITVLRGQFSEDQVDIDGIAEMSKVPRMMRGMVRSRFRREMEYPVMLDWTGAVTALFQFKEEVANVYVIDRNGKVVQHLSGEATEEGLKSLIQTIQKLLGR